VIYRFCFGTLALAVLASLGCPPPAPPAVVVPQGTPCAQLVIACYDELSHDSANLPCFLPRSRWNRTDLRWKLADFLPNLTQAEQFTVAERAFNTWSTVSSLTFQRVEATEAADIVVSFVTDEHGDSFPFDGVGDVLGHAFFPSSPSPGAVHIDAAGVLATQPAAGEFALYAILLHEIGHALGLEHDPDVDSVMASTYHVRDDEGLATSDVDAILRLYGSHDGAVAPLAVLPPAECTAPPGNLTADNPDTDGDGIPDTIEIFVLGTDFNNVDTDGDGVSDYDEVFRDGTPPNNPISPNDPDDDGDFLSRSKETQFGTDPASPDTDGDGLLDGLEVFVLGTDPLKPDTDDDGVDDASDPFPTNASFAGDAAQPRPLPDCNGNTVRDDIDIAAGTSGDCNENGVPDECDVDVDPALDCNRNGVPDDCDLSVGTSTDANHNDRPDDCEAGNVCADGDLCTSDRVEDGECVHLPRDCDDGVFCNGVEVCDGGDCLPGTPPCAANESCDETTDACVPPSGGGGGGGGGGGPPPPPDCNSNGIADDLDIAAGTSVDVNKNSIPDECETVSLFVNQNAGGANDGSSWPNAFVNLTVAITKAKEQVDSGAVAVEVWVAKGTYFPTVPGVGKRSDSFRLLSGVGFYGGFSGTESTRAARSLAVNPTVLSGDFTQNDGVPQGPGQGDNSFHVVDASSVNSTAVLDGFVVTAGRADEPQVPQFQRGGGLFIVNGSPVIRNCTFQENSALQGGAISIAGGSPTFLNTVVAGNASLSFGGGVWIEAPTVEARFINCTVARNVSSNGCGGGIAVQASVLTLTNSIVASNFDGECNDQINAFQSELKVSYSFVQDASNFGGSGNIGPGLAPGFVNSETIDVHLAPGSPCIDAGDNSQVPAFLSTDRDGGVRIVDDPQTSNTGNPTTATAIVDMGAFEFSAVTAERIPSPGPTTGP